MVFAGFTPHPPHSNSYGESSQVHTIGLVKKFQPLEGVENLKLAL